MARKETEEQRREWERKEGWDEFERQQEFERWKSKIINDWRGNNPPPPLPRQSNT